MRNTNKSFAVLERLVTGEKATTPDIVLDAKLELLESLVSDGLSISSEVGRAIPSDKQDEFIKYLETRILRSTIDMMEGVSKVFVDPSLGNNEMRTKILRKRGDYERSLRRFDLLAPCNSDDFAASLQWMTQKATVEDLPYLKKAKESPHFADLNNRNLIQRAEKKAAEAGKLKMTKPLKPENMLGKDDIDKVLLALSDSRWDFRTVIGLETETGLESGVIINILEANPSVRKCAIPDKAGSSLYTLRENRVSHRERLAEFWFYLRLHFNDLS